MTEWCRLGDCHSFFGLAKGAVVGTAHSTPAASAQPGQAAAAPLAAAQERGAASTRDVAGSSLSATRSSGSPAPEPESGPWMRNRQQDIVGSTAMATTFSSVWTCHQRRSNERDRVISTLEFDESGDFLAVGEVNGNVTILKREHGSGGWGEYRDYFELAAHETEFDSLKSVEISERVNCVRWLPGRRSGSSMLTCNDKTVKLWRISNGSRPAAAYKAQLAASGRGKGDGLLQSAAGSLRGLGKTAVQAKQRQAYRNAHNYTINSISCCSDGECFLSSDDLRIYLWNYERSNETFMTLDLKPDNLEDLTEVHVYYQPMHRFQFFSFISGRLASLRARYSVPNQLLSLTWNCSLQVITTAKFHPRECNLIGFSNSRGQAKLHDLRERALCNHHRTALNFSCSTVPGDSDGLFDELISSISDINFGSRYLFVRDFLTLKVWDIAMPRQPVSIVNVAESLRPRLGELWETERIFDRFEVAVSPTGDEFATGSYGNTVAVWGAEGGEDHGWCQAGCEQTIQRPWRGPPANASLENRALSVVWHPRDRMIAFGIDNTLFIHGQPLSKLVM
eukprot:SAG31_NODE_2352_length_5882_cov_3.464465_4_plen_565_part_00